MEDKYSTPIIGSIRKWWDSKTLEEQKEFVMDVANAGIAVMLVAGSVVVTKKTMDRLYELKEQERLKDMARFSTGDIIFDVNSEKDICHIHFGLTDPVTGDRIVYGKLTGNVDEFKRAAGLFTDAASYIDDRRAANQYAKVICGFDQQLKKYHKEM